MNHRLQCRCGTLKGLIKLPGPVNRVVCYCRDCQAFAHYLGRPQDTLDVHGGSDVVQVLPANVTFTEGTSALACMRLAEKGLLRWYAKCCNTPIGNTLADYRISFIGLLHDCLTRTGQSLDESFGPVRARSFTAAAHGNVVSSKVAMAAAIARVARMVVQARVDGSYNCRLDRKRASTIGARRQVDTNPLPG
jgi:hypothetical protein